MIAALEILTPDWRIQIQPGTIVSVLGCRHSLAPHLLSALASRNLSNIRNFTQLDFRMSSRPISAYTPTEYVELVSFFPGDPDVFFSNLYVDEELGFFLENLAMPAPEINRAISDVASVFGVSNLMHRKLRSLSGGQKQLVALAATLSAGAEFILLDDPLSNLDYDNRQITFEILKSYKRKGRTIIFSELDLSEWSIRADNLIVFDGSTLLREGPPEMYQKNHKHTIRTDLGAIPQQTHSTATPEAIPSRKQLIISDLVYGYSKEEPIIYHASADVRLEGPIALVGKNGSGKSTLARLIAGLLKPLHGSISLMNFSSPNRKVRVAYAFQNPRLQFLTDSVSNEILFPFTASSAPAHRVELRDRLIRIFELFDVQSHHPIQLPPLQQRRLILAALLASEPHLLIIDEPTNGLDLYEKTQMGRNLAEIAESGVSMILISHDSTILSGLARSTLIMDGGKIIQG
jgi:energy-coupling factor transport system ATP-binding protein